MKIISTCFFIFSFAIAGYSQQAAQYSLYMWNKYAYNPAYAGMENSLSLTGVYRNQWDALPGNPVTQGLSAHMPLYIASGGIGIDLENESIGSWNQTAANISYNYQMELNDRGVLSLGLSAGIVQRELDGSKVRTPGGVYEEDGSIIDHGENDLPIGTESGSAPAFHTGLYYQGKRLEIGISAKNLLNNKISFSGVNFKPERTYYLLLGYQFDIGRNLTVHPSTLVKSDVYQTQMDFSIITRYNENIFFGATFRGYDTNSRDAVVLTGGFKFSERFMIGYAYDITLSNLNTVSNGTHEILINYNLGKQIGKGRPPIIIYNPRSL